MKKFLPWLFFSSIFLLNSCAGNLYKIRVEKEINAPKEVVWNVISDHENTHKWVEQVEKVTLIKKGEKTKNGLGAVRIVKFKNPLWGQIHERITLFKPPYEFNYFLFEGMTGLEDHLGKFIIEKVSDDKVIVNWNVDLKFQDNHIFNIFAPSFAVDFEKVLESGLLELKEQLEDN